MTGTYINGKREYPHQYVTFDGKSEETVFFKNDVVVEDNKSQIAPDGTDETEFAEIDFIALSQDRSISNCRSVIDEFNDKEFDGIEAFCAIEKNESKLVLKRYKNPGYHSQVEIAKDKQFLRNKVCSISNFSFNIEVLYETSSGFAERHVFLK